MGISLENPSHIVSILIIIYFPLENLAGAVVCSKSVVLGGELAVPFTRNPLYAGLNPRPRVLKRIYRTISIGHRATDGHEPRQVRKEAAISDAVCVVD